MTSTQKASLKPILSVCLTFGVGVAIFAIGALGAAPQYVLKARYSKGETHSYAIATAIYGYLPNNRPVSMEFDMKMNVLKVSGGNATIQLISGTPKSGQGDLPARFKESTVVLNALNRPVAASHTGQIFAMFPNHAVKVGDTWTGISTLILSGKQGAMVETTYKLDSVHTVEGRSIAELGLTLGGLAKGKGTALVDVLDGSLLSSDTRITAGVSSGKVVPIEIVLKRVR
jgi:hypothetical protein